MVSRRVEGVGRRRTGFPILPLPFLSSVDEGLRVTVPIVEGKVYRIGEMKIEGNSIFSEDSHSQRDRAQQGRRRQR